MGDARRQTQNKRLSLMYYLTLFINHFLMMYLYSILNIFYNPVHQFVILIYGIITYYCLFAAIVP